MFCRSVSRCVRQLLLPEYSSCRTHQAAARWFGQAAAQTHPHLLQDGEVTPGLTTAEYRRRRGRLAQSLRRAGRNFELAAAQSDLSRRPERHLVIVPSATRLYMTHDIPYPFRQNTEFLYLCGFQEPDSVLLVEVRDDAAGDVSDTEHTATLFVPKRIPHKELWEGERSGVDGAVALTGIDHAHDIDELGVFLSRFHHTNPNTHVWYDGQKPAHVDFHFRYLTDFLSKTGGSESPRRMLQSLRLVKSEAEVALMEKSCQIASEAFVDVMRFSHSNVNEAHLQAKMDYECRLRGAEYLAYPPVVAGGNRANTIHYTNNNQIVRRDEMVLMDAGCEYHGYASDITRSWPVSGTFSSVQREVYEALLEVNETCISLATVSNSVESIFLEMLTRLGVQLQRLGVLSGDLHSHALQTSARQFCPHHVGHYLGMDVHDTDEMPRNINLRPGMVITIEPGLYFPATNRQVAAELRGLGMRIEDNILITESEPINLTRGCPKDPDDIQSVVNSGKKTNSL